MISYRISCFTPVKPSESNSHQRSALQRSQPLIVKPSNIQFHQLPTNSIQRDIDRSSPILVRRLRPTIEHFTFHRQPIDLEDFVDSQLNLVPSSSSIARNQSPRITTPRSKPAQYSKTMSEKSSKSIPKSSQPLLTPIWSPILTKKQIVPFQTSRSKSVVSKYSTNVQQYQIQHNQTKPPIFDLSISSHMVNHKEELLKKTTIKHLVDECEDQKSKLGASSNDDDSIITNCNNPLLKFTAPNRLSSFDQFASPVFIPQQRSSSTNNQFQQHHFTSH